MSPLPRRKKTSSSKQHGGPTGRFGRPRPAKRPSRPGLRPRVPAPPKPAASLPSAERVSGERLQKVLASAGLGSRRECEELITAGRVEVDGQVVAELGTRVDAESQEIRVDGEPIRVRRRLYFAVYKPRGVVSTSRDPAGRPRVIDLVPRQADRLYAVGRLDMNSEGLILVTNDGELANRLTHPRYGVQKTYRVMVAGEPSPEVLKQLREGVRLDVGVARVDSVKVKSRHGKSSVLEMVLSEGRNREIRRIMAKTGHKVMRLMRMAVGPVKLGPLGPGEVRKLTREEVESLRKLVRHGRA